MNDIILSCFFFNFLFSWLCVPFTIAVSLVTAHAAERFLHIHVKYIFMACGQVTLLKALGVVGLRLIKP